MNSNQPTAIIVYQLHDLLQARDIKSKDSALRSLANKLKETERVLDILVDDYSDYYRPGKRLKVSDILSYAHTISYTTFAPPEFAAGRGALPPAPQEEQMRASVLYDFKDLDVGIPKTTTDEIFIEPFVETTINPGLIPSNIVMPPGRPMELPSDLPILPGLGRGPEPIQVRRVQLDIEDDSSDCSSDDDSSDCSSDDDGGGSDSSD